MLTNPPTFDDFVSNMVLGRRPLQEDQETLRLWAGISVYNSRRRARQQARRMPWLGAFIAELQIPEEGSITFERTTNSQGHYTLWGDAEAMLACVISVVPVSEPLASERE